MHVECGVGVADRMRGACRRDETVTCAPFRRNPAQPAAGHVAGNDADPGREYVDLVTPADPLQRAGARLVDGIAGQVGVAGDESHRRDQLRVVEGVEVVEPPVGHAR